MIFKNKPKKWLRCISNGNTFSSKTVTAPPADVITTPQTGYSFVSPYMEDYSRRLLASYFGSPGEYEGLISQARDIPIEQTAGLTPLQIQARQSNSWTRRLSRKLRSSVWSVW